MSQWSIKLGYWSAISCIILNIIWATGLVMAFSVFPIPAWTNLAEFVAAAQPISLVIGTTSQVAAFLLGPLSMILLCCLHDYAPDDKKILARIGVCYMVATMVLGGQLYFVHFNSMRLVLSRGIVTGLEQFVEWNADSPIAASGFLGWTFFWGLASLFVAPIFAGGRLERGLRYTSLICGICGTLGAVGFLLENTVLLVVYLVGAMVVGTLSLVLESILFKRLDNDAALKAAPTKPGLS